MISLRGLGLTAFAALALSQDIATPRENRPAVSAKRQSSFFEVESCHAHGDALFCIYEGDEWEVTSGSDVESAPESFEGCHSHSGTEM